ncbi:MAG: Stf0 family sulfotransferase [Henriciella sp.]|jgi:LPS sulfotransferase NodH
MIVGLPKERMHRLKKSLQRLDELYARAKPNDPEVVERRAAAARRREKLLDRSGGKTKITLVCMTPRSGSTFFSEALRVTEQLGNPGEWFNAHDTKSIDTIIEKYGCQTREDVLDHIYNFSSTDNGVCVIKGDYFQCLPFIFDGLFEQHFDIVKFVFLTREDLLAQAISRYVGTVTGSWSSAQKAAKTEVPYDRPQIDKQLKFLLDMEEGWRHFFASRGIRPTRMSYEQLTRNLSGKVQQIAKLMNIKLAVEMQPEDLALKKQGSSRNKDWAAVFASETKDAAKVLAKLDKAKAKVNS